MRGDPILELSGGDWLEVFSDHPVDPRVMRLSTITFVGSPSYPECTSDGVPWNRPGRRTVTAQNRPFIVAEVQMLRAAMNGRRSDGASGTFAHT